VKEWNFKESGDVINLVDGHKEEGILFGVEKVGGEVVEFEMVARESPPEGEGSLG